MRVLVCGSRDWADVDKIDDELHALTYQYPGAADIVIVEGGARGADRIGREWAERYELGVETFKADWDKFGSQAGFIRNQAMIDSKPDLVLAYWDGESRGTKHTILAALKAKINTRVTFP